MFKLYTQFRQQPQTQMWNPPQVQSSDTQFSDLSDTFDMDTVPQRAPSPDTSFLEAVDGVQPEWTKCPNEMKIKCEYLK